MNNIAKPYIRIISGILDNAINLLPFVYITYLVSVASDIETLLNSIWNAVVVIFLIVIIMPFFKAYMNSSFGGTFGKLLTGVKIVNASGENLTFWRAFFRNHLGYMVSGMVFWLGFIWIFIDKERRGWHDMMADTYVVVVNKNKLILGIVMMILFVGLNTFLIKTSVESFKINSELYLSFLN